MIATLIEMIEQIYLTGRTSYPLLISGIAIGVASLWVVFDYFFGKKIGNKKLLENNQEKYAVPLIEKEELSHDTRRFRFGLPTTEHVLGLPTGQHISLSTTINDKLVARSYTPVSCDDDKGYLDLVVKVYFANVHPKFPNGGQMSQYLEQMKLGDTINIRGPNGNLVYKGAGRFSIRESARAAFTSKIYRQVGMIAGGTGITPMLQIIRQAFRDDNDGTLIWLLYANQTESDILLREELEQLSKDNPERLKLWYTLDRPSEGWQYSTGFINEEMIGKRLPAPADNTIVLMCGPPPMIKHACLPNLEKLGHKQTNLFAY